MTFSVTNTFVNGSIANANEVNTNFDDVENELNDVTNNATFKGRVFVKQIYRNNGRTTTSGNHQLDSTTISGLTLSNRIIIHFQVTQDGAGNSTVTVRGSDGTHTIDATTTSGNPGGDEQCTIGEVTLLQGDANTTSVIKSTFFNSAVFNAYTGLGSGWNADWYLGTITLSLRCNNQGTAQRWNWQIEVI
jgi:hypothetical protein